MQLFASVAEGMKERASAVQKSLENARADLASAKQSISAYERELQLNRTALSGGNVNENSWLLVGRLAKQGGSMHELFCRIETLAARSVDGCIGALYLHDPSRGDVYRCTNGDVKRVKLRAGILEHVICTRAAVNIADVTLDPRFSTRDIDHLDLDAEMVSVSSLIALPVMPCDSIDGERCAVGVIQIVNKASAGAFTDKDEWRLVQVCAQISLVVEMWRKAVEIRDLSASVETLNGTVDELKQELSASSQHHDHLRARADMFTALGHEDDLDSIFSIITSRAHALCEADCAALYLLKSDVDELVSIVDEGASSEDDAVIPIGHGFVDAQRVVLARWCARRSLLTI